MKKLAIKVLVYTTVLTAGLALLILSICAVFWPAYMMLKTGNTEWMLLMPFTATPSIAAVLFLLGE